MVHKLAYHITEALRIAIFTKGTKMIEELLMIKKMLVSQNEAMMESYQGRPPHNTHTNVTYEPVHRCRNTHHQQYEGSYRNNDNKNKEYDKRIVQAQAIDKGSIRKKKVRLNTDITDKQVWRKGQK